MTTPLGKDALLLVGFSGEEAISQPFRFALDALAEGANVSFEKLLGQKVGVTLETAPGKTRDFNGICVRVTEGERGPFFTQYQLEIVPQFYLLKRVAQSRIFQQLAVPDILKKVLTGLDVAWEIQGTFPSRDYCVQYRETDFAFACRLMEEEGIYYFFKHTAGGHQMVLANTPGSHPDVGTASQILYADINPSELTESRIFDWQKAQELRSGKYTLWDHTFELPHKHLEADRLIQETVQAGTVPHRLKVGGNEKLEIYDFPGEYAQRFDGVQPGGGDRAADVQKVFTDNKRTVEIRMQQEALPSLLVQGNSNCRQLASGHKFTLQNHFNGNGPYVLVSVQHSASLSANYRSGGSGGYHYHNHFTCIPLGLVYRPPRLTPKPFVQGCQTAVVVGPKGNEIFTDKYGRIKVQFHWDRQGKNDADSSCWVRVAQLWAGKRWGASFWPRIGQEVVVDFLEGDPDQPIVIGSVYNAEQMPPYLGEGPDDKHRSDNKIAGIKTNTTPGGKGFNELRFDDTRDKEQVFVHAQRDYDLRVLHDARERILHDHHRIVGADKDGQKVGDERALIYQDSHLHVKRDQVEHVEGNFKLTVGKGDAQDGGNVEVLIEKVKKELVEKDSHLHVKGGRSEKVDGTQSLTAGEQHEKIDQNHALEAGMAIHIKAGTTLVIEAGLQLTLKVGGNFIDINPTGVAIQGTMVLINSGGAAGSGAGAKPQAAQDAAPAEPTAPDEADNAKTGSKSAPG
jgi:type VI secretion system secreted protein VgrG